VAPMPVLEPALERLAAELDLMRSE